MRSNDTIAVEANLIMLTLLIIERCSVVLEAGGER
jgi:hypothetical protein